MEVEPVTGPQLFRCEFCGLALLHPVFSPEDHGVYCMWCPKRFPETFGFNPDPILRRDELRAAIARAAGALITGKRKRGRKPRDPMAVNPSWNDRHYRRHATR